MYELVDNKYFVYKDFVSKPKHPKGWSYPLKTTEIKKAIKELKFPLHIYYNASPPRDADFNLILVSFNGNDPSMTRYYMRVNLVKSDYRQIAHDLLIKLLPKINDWMHKVEKWPTTNLVNVRYRKAFINDPAHVFIDDNGKVAWKENIVLQD